MWAKLYVIGANLDGSDSLAVEWNITHAIVNGTVKYEGEPMFPPGQP